MRLRWIIAALIATAAPALAQSPATIDQRVGKLEKEVRAVQRVVFPQGQPVQPETGAAVPEAPAGAPASSPLADLNARLDALERQVRTLTGQVEQVEQRGRLQDESLRKLEARVSAIEGPPAGAAAPDPATGGAATAATAVARPAPAPAKPAATSRPDPARRTALAAIEIPATGDAAEDGYTYAFRLYTAKFYPEAQAKLKEFVTAFPKHRRASYAQNLLGRAYLDEGKPALASVAFFDSYQKMPKGERASESLYWLGQALTRLGKLPDACKVYAEFGEVYGPTAPAELRTRVAKGRADAKCAA